MKLDIRINKDRMCQVNLISRHDNYIKISVDDKIYDLDICKVEDTEYSIIKQGVSHNIEVIENDSPKKYIANTYYLSYEMEIIDSETRYQQNRNKGLDIQEQNIISTPMPGKIVRIPVKVGDKVVAGQSVIVVSAMKMESEYKVSRDAVVKKILVNVGDTVKSNQPLIQIE